MENSSDLLNFLAISHSSSICLFVALRLFREEYGKLFDFVNAKKLNIKNRGFKEVMRCFHNES